MRVDVAKQRVQQMHRIAVLVDADRDGIFAAFDERGRRVVMLKIDDHYELSSLERISVRRLSHGAFQNTKAAFQAPRNNKEHGPKLIGPCSCETNSKRLRC